MATLRLRTGPLSPEGLSALENLSRSPVTAGEARKIRAVLVDFRAIAEPTLDQIDQLGVALAGASGLVSTTGTVRVEDLEEDLDAIERALADVPALGRRWVAALSLALGGAGARARALAAAVAQDDAHRPRAEVIARVGRLAVALGRFGRAAMAFLALLETTERRAG